MGWPNPKKEAEKAIRKVIDSVLKPAARGCENGINKLGASVRTTVRKAGHEAEELIDGATDKAEDRLRKVEDGITDKLPQLAEEAVEKVVDELTDAPIEAGLKKAAQLCHTFHARMEHFQTAKPELVDAINDTGFSFSVQAVVSLGLCYEQFYSRAAEVAGVLDRFANDGLELRRRDIIGLVRACGPTRVAVGGGAELSLGVQLGVEGAVEMPLELFLEVGDELLAEMGVPQ